MADVPQLPAACRRSTAAADDPMGAARAAGRHVPARAGAYLVRRRPELHQLRARLLATVVITVAIDDGARDQRARPARAALPTAGRPAGPGRAGPASPGFSTEGGRAVGAGPAHRQLVAAQRVGPAHRRLRLRHLVQGHAGQFVVTIGGYHPKFDKPAATRSSPGSASPGNRRARGGEGRRPTSRSRRRASWPAASWRSRTRAPARCGPSSRSASTCWCRGTRSSTTSGSTSRSRPGCGGGRGSARSG